MLKQIVTFIAIILLAASCSQGNKVAQKNLDPYKHREDSIYKLYPALHAALDTAKFYYYGFNLTRALLAGNEVQWIYESEVVIQDLKRNQVGDYIISFDIVPDKLSCTDCEKMILGSTIYYMNWFYCTYIDHVLLDADLNLCEIYGSNKTYHYFDGNFFENYLNEYRFYTDILFNVYVKIYLREKPLNPWFRNELMKRQIIIIDPNNRS